MWLERRGNELRSVIESLAPVWIDSLKAAAISKAVVMRKRSELRVENETEFVPYKTPLRVEIMSLVRAPNSESTEQGIQPMEVNSRVSSSTRFNIRSNMGTVNHTGS
jgi:hypothetical protein